MDRAMSVDALTQHEHAPWSCKLDKVVQWGAVGLGWAEPSKCLLPMQHDAGAWENCSVATFFLGGGGAATSPSLSLPSDSSFTAPFLPFFVVFGAGSAFARALALGCTARAGWGAASLSLSLPSAAAPTMGAFPGFPLSAPSFLCSSGIHI